MRERAFRRLARISSPYRQSEPSDYRARSAWSVARRKTTAPELEPEPWSQHLSADPISALAPNPAEQFVKNLNLSALFWLICGESPRLGRKSRAIDQGAAEYSRRVTSTRCWSGAQRGQKVVERRFERIKFRPQDIDRALRFDPLFVADIRNDKIALRGIDFLTRIPQRLVDRRRSPGARRGKRDLKNPSSAGNAANFLTRVLDIRNRLGDLGAGLGDFSAHVFNALLVELDQLFQQIAGLADIDDGIAVAAFMRRGGR